MKSKFFFLSVLFLMVTVLGMRAQVDSYLRSKTRVATSRAAQNADSEVNSQINKGVDKEFNKLKGKLLGNDDDESVENEEAEVETEEDNSTGVEEKSSAGSSGNDAMSRALMGKMGINMTRPANLQDNYDYTGNLKMDIESWDEEGNSDGPMDYITFYSDKSAGFAIQFKDKEKGKSIMIFDYDNQMMIILGDDGNDKNGFVTPLGAPGEEINTGDETEEISREDAEKAEELYSGFKKTGRSKTIAGYKCEEYYNEDEEAKMTYWMTTEISRELWSKMYSSNVFTSLYTGSATGFVMESDYQEKNSKERSHMIVKEVNPNQASRISTVGYTIMTMSVPQGETDTE